MRMDENISRLQYLLAGVLIVVGFVLLSFLLVVAKNIVNGEPMQASANRSYSNNLGDGVFGTSNAVTVSINQMGNGIAKVVDSIGDDIADSTRSTTSTVSHVTGTVTRTITNGVSSAARVTVNGFSTVAKAASTGFVAIIHAPGQVFGTVLTPTTSAQAPVIEPRTIESSPINTSSALIKTANVELPRIGLKPAWPMHGRITTYFGVPHQPYQVTHTGMDISSGHGSGVVQIKPFMSGKVVDTVYSSRGLGNHIIVDHGGGITSVYGHLYSISVQIGQEVDMNTALGYEGSTGVSTGTHLHFEVRKNGYSANPQEYITGTP